MLPAIRSAALWTESCAQMRVAPATQLRPHRAHHLEGSRLIFQGLGNVLAQQIQCAAAIRAARLFGFQPLGFPGNVADSGPHVGRVEGSSRMFGNRFSASTSCSRWPHETEPGRPNPSLSC